MGAERRPARARGIALAWLAAAGLLLALEGAASVALALNEARWGPRKIAEERHSEYDADLGWRHRPGRTNADLYGPGKHMTVDARGFRCAPNGPGGQVAPDASGAPPEGARERYRVVCLGDSFTQGYGVGDLETFPARLAARCPSLEAINMGMGGFGLDQVYLWYLRDGAPLDADLVLLTLIAPDFDRMGTAKFVGRYAKPVLALEDGRIAVHNVPVPRGFAESSPWRVAQGFLAGLAMPRAAARALGREWGTPDAGDEDPPRVRPPWSQDPSRPVAEAVLVELARHARERGQRLAIAYVPIRGLARWPDHAERRAWLAATAASAGVPCLDMTDPIGALPIARLDEIYQADSHLTAAGNDWLAEAIRAGLALAIEEWPCGP